jgi:hypothetical protein
MSSIGPAQQAAIMPSIAQCRRLSLSDSTGCEPLGIENLVDGRDVVAISDSTLKVRLLAYLIVSQPPRRVARHERKT